jgi:murein DD-endopeptidase MepM/ murein hydrolase activator NlpD
MDSKSAPTMVRATTNRHWEGLIPRRRVKIFVAAVVFLAIVVGQGDPAASEPCWAPPVDGVVVDAFREPLCPWCAGNRGIEYKVAHSTIVSATATGRVTFSGTVVGTRYVVIQLARGWRLTYGQLSATHLATGDVVVAGSEVGRTTGGFFFGVRAGNVYLDPAPYLGRLVGRQRLVPADSSSPRPSTTTRLRCEPVLASR